MKRQVLIQLLLVALSACGPSQPCPSCEDDGADDLPVDLAEEMPDLPCGGADLQNDNQNCGKCETMCWPQAEGSAHEAGGCVAGVCGPRWHGQEWLEPSPLTCDDVCGTLSCHANGCSGLTGFVCESIFGQPCTTISSGSPPLLDLSGACDEPLPWPEVWFEGDRHVYCCCG